MNLFNRQALSMLVAAWGAAGGAQAASLICGTPLRVSTTSVADWSTDARYVAAPSGAPATIVDDYSWGGWFDPTAVSPAMTAKWLSFGAAAADAVRYPAVNTRGVAANGAWVTDRSTFIYNEPITIGPDVNLASIRVTGRGGADNNVVFSVKPATLPGNVANNGTIPWIHQTALPLAWGSPSDFQLDGSTSGLGFYYGDNSIGLSTWSEATTAALPTGVIADFEITADCLAPPAPPPTTPLLCPAGNQAGDTVRIGPFTTNARDWSWSWRTSNGSPAALEHVSQPLYDDFIWRDYFKPAALPAASATNARWISPGTVDPAGADIPGVPYPFASGQAKGGFYGSVFTMKQPVVIGNNIDLASIRLDGRFGFDDTGDSVFVQPLGQPAPAPFASNTLPDGYGAFSSVTTPPVPGFMRGQNTVGLVLNGGQFANDCRGGTCALAAIADFYITATCTGEAPIDPVLPATSVPTLDAAGLGLLSLLGAGAGALALRRRRRRD